MKKTLQAVGLLGVSQSHPLKKNFSKKMKKPLDKLPKIWYNKDTPKEKIKN